MPSEKVSVEECRRILGPEAANMTDADIETLRDNLERAADALYTEMTADLQEGRASLDEWREVALMDSETIPPWLNTDAEQAKRDAIERIRWMAHHQETGEGE